MSAAASPFPEHLEITGEGLVLRDWTESDLDAMPALFDHPDIAYWTPIVSPSTRRPPAPGWSGAAGCGRTARRYSSRSPSTAAPRSAR
ncbi:hypothetical protein ACFQ60_45175 [Streptomyces zhihengii]